MKPSAILTKWNCEELMVAYGVYIDQKSNEYVESIPEREWAKHKPEPISWLDRWAVLFIGRDQMAELANDQKKTLDQMDVIEAAQTLFQ